MVAHWGDLLVTGLLATVSVASICGQVVTRGILVPPVTQNNSSIRLPCATVFPPCVILQILTPSGSRFLVK